MAKPIQYCKVKNNNKKNFLNKLQKKNVIGYMNTGVSVQGECAEGMNAPKVRLNLPHREE